MNTLIHAPPHTSFVAAAISLFGLHKGTTRWWSEGWFLTACSAAIPIWVALWGLQASSATSFHSASLLLLLSLVFWQPLLEEVSFRGLMQGALLDCRSFRSTFGPLTMANLCTSLLFALAHVPTHPVSWVMGIFLVSLLLGYARDNTGSLYPAIVLHCYFNAGYFLISGLPQ